MAKENVKVITKPVNFTLDSQKVTFDFLKAHLWSAADILRGSLDPSEYRQPLMTLLFLKRLNDTFEENAAKDRTKIKTLYRNTVQIERETGRQETYLGFPFLSGFVSQDKYIRGPLLLFPITLEYRREGRTSGWFITFSKYKRATVNRALIEALKNSNVTFPDSISEELEELIEQFPYLGNTDTFGLDKEDFEHLDKIEIMFFNKLVGILLSNKFPIESVLSEALKRTQPLEPISLQDQRNLDKKQKLHLINHKILGNFPQGDTSLYNDYNELIDKVRNGEGNLGIIDDLLELPHDDVWEEGLGDERTDINPDEIKPNQLRLVLESDPSQDSIIS